MVLLSMAGSSTDTAATLTARKRQRSKAQDLVADSTYTSMVASVQKSVKDAAGQGSGPMDTLSKLKEERKAAKAKSAEKAKEVNTYAKRVARLQARAAKLSDDGLLVEYARRQAAKDRKRQLSFGRDNP